jgi:hypothetical protein
VTVYIIAAPRAQRRVAQITEFDLSLFDGPVTLKPNIYGINIDEPTQVVATAATNRKTLEGMYKFIIQYTDGVRARATFVECQAVLTALGQDWPRR